MQSEYKFKQKYNPKSNRLQYYDYSSNGGYFITICTKNREDYFGEIIDGEMVLNKYGEIVNNEILNTGRMRKNVIIDEFIVMPNHIHLILFICNDDNNLDYNPVETDCICLGIQDTCNRDTGTFDRDTCNRDTYNIDTYNVSLRGLEQEQTKGNRFGPQKNNLGSIIRGIKGGIYKQINQLDQGDFSWQPNYYDHIIRNEIELNKIRQYIIDNPIKWELEKNKGENLYM